MDNKTKLILLIGSLLLVIITFWGFKYNNAYIQIESSESAYKAVVDQNSFDCNENCLIKLKPGSYTLVINKSGYQPVENKLFLTRGSTSTIAYDPIFIPEFKSVAISPQSLSRVQILDSGAEQISILTTSGSYQPVATFRLPLENPKITVSPDLTTAVAWTENEFYLINNLQQTRQKLALPTELNNITNLKLISNDYLVIESDTIYLFSFNSKRLISVPANSVDHLQLLSASEVLFFSSQTLTEQSINLSGVPQITSLVDKKEEELESELLLPADKIYLYDLATEQFKFLGKLPSNIQEPFQINTVLIDQIPQQVLTTQQESFLVINSPN